MTTSKYAYLFPERDRLAALYAAGMLLGIVAALRLDYPPGQTAAQVGVADFALFCSTAFLVRAAGRMRLAQAAALAFALGQVALQGDGRLSDVWQSCGLAATLLAVQILARVATRAAPPRSLRTWTSEIR